VIQQLSRRGFYLPGLDDVDDVENLLMMSDELHQVSPTIIKSLSFCIKKSKMANCKK